MMSQYKSLFVLLMLGVSLGGCSTENSDAVLGAHPEGWLCTHSAEALQNPSGCTSCHGADYNGSGQVPGCFSCHLGSAPTFSVHPNSWAVTITNHQPFAFDNSWTSCAVAACHGANLRGGSNSFCATGPSCFTTVGCHTTPDNSPPPPHSMPNVTPADHGPDAKNFTGDGQDQLYCRNCHGIPLNNFDGGYVTTAILGHPVANGACSATVCHSNAKAHPTEWQGTNDQTPSYSSTHRTVDQTTVDRACTLCHKTTAFGAGPMPGAPSCFSTNFTNANSITSGCHANGPGVAPHSTNGTYRDPDNHGPDAKTNLGLNFCKDCHAQQLANGNYRFNIAIGQLINGCEDCHAANAAHPPAPLVLPSTDRWTFRGAPTSTRRTHFAAADPLTNCTLCHGAALNGVGGTGPTCYSCHDSAVALPNFKLLCSACHASPPDGTADLTGSPTPVNHSLPGGDVSAVADHDDCATCHGAKDDGTGKLAQRNGNYLLFDRTTAPQGGDHLDGQIEMNGPTASNTGAAYNFADQGCDLACHGNDPAHQIDRNSGLVIAYGDYGGGSGVAGCTGCHTYPPDGTADSTTAIPVSHLFGDNGVTLLNNHNECQLCHGTKDDGSGGHSPATNYNPATDHNTTPHQININTTLQYVSTAGTDFGGCNNSCHGNNATHRFPNSSGLTIVGADYGSASCAGCHDTGANGAPQVRVGDPHAAQICESCHPGGNRGVLHGDGGNVNVVLIPNNLTVGIDYSANGEAGIYLGGDATIGTTEAEICWNCHDGNGISEWGQNTKANTGSMLYNYGSLSTSNWTVATWSSAQDDPLANPPKTLFRYKRGVIQSTHAANPDLTDGNSSPGLDAVSDIRCSNCHDVHDLNLAPGDTVTGQPYLRGTWKGNPYKEDGAPQAGTSFQNLSRAGATPRGNPSQFSTHASGLGGYQIDQNNGFPTWNGGAPRAGWQPEQFAGLCELCHGIGTGNGDGIWSASEIDNLNYYGTPSNDWVGINGHANSVIGGTGGASGNASNIFDLRGGNLANSTNPAMAFMGANNPGNSGTFGFRGRSGSAARWLPQPTTSKPKIYQINSGGYEWGATINSSTIDSRYHHFPCSKCHNPHAARLPRLMIANCLDTKHNTWDDSYQFASSPQAGSNNINRTLSNWTSAQNCHRLGGVSTAASFEPIVPGAVPGTGAGWNNRTPFD